MKIFRLFFLAVSFLGGFAVASVRAADTPRALLPLYEKVSTALAADNLPGAQAAASALAAEAAQHQQTDVAKAAAAVGHAADLAAARQAFKGLSADAIPIARRQKGYFIYHCPMAEADWVQSTPKAANPYLGKEMLTCGTVTEKTQG